MKRPRRRLTGLVTELAAEGPRQAAFDRAWRWYGGPEPTSADLEAIRGEWEEGWSLARGQARENCMIALGLKSTKAALPV